MYPITLTKKLEDIEICGIKLGDLDHPDFRYPWEIIFWLRDTIKSILELRVTSYELREDNLYVGKNVVVSQYVVFDIAAGRIIIDDNVKIGPFSYIQGPCYIGKNCEIMPHSQIRKNTSIGHTCKIGGEVSGSIIQPYTNKAHYGFIGDSYIGSWVNLGAGTSCSNLKNTYGPIRVEYSAIGSGLHILTHHEHQTGSRQEGTTQQKSGPNKINTGQQFLGCIIGDYAKTAINTSIYTGKIIGVCAQLFGVIKENVGSFIMKMPDGSQKTFKLEAALRMQKRMFKRRGIKHSQKDIEMLKRIFEKTKNARL